MRVLKIEKTTVAAMIRIYCRGRHGFKTLCPACTELAAYTHHKLDRCPFGDQKPTCLKCSIHCYQPSWRAQIREVMRYSGPRMTYRHPWLAFLHFWKEARPRRA